MLTPASVRSSSTSFTASGSRRTYSCTSSFALRPFASSRTCVHVQSYAGENLFDLGDSVRFILGTLARQRLGIFRLVFWKIFLKNFGKIVRKVSPSTDRSRGFHPRNLPAL